MASINLETITATLEGLEETIIYRLLDRAQFKENKVVYTPGKSGFEGAEGRDCLFELRLRYHERMDSVFGRFCVAEERPFCDHLPEQKRKVTITDTFLKLGNYDVVNLTREIKKMYIESIDRFCIAGDDGQYGSSVEHDVYALQALSRRVHYGAMYVAETKYQGNPELYQRLINSRDTHGMDALLTRKDVEDKIIERVREKVMRIQGFVNQTVRRIVDPDVFISLYRNRIIPLTKKGEIIYLLNRENSNTGK